MRLYPVWNIVHDDHYDDLVDALLISRSLTRDALKVGPMELIGADAPQTAVH